MSSLPLRLLLVVGCSASCAIPTSSALRLGEGWWGVNPQRSRGMLVKVLLPLRGGGVGSILDLDGEEQQERGIIPAERRMALRLDKDKMRTGNPVPGPEDQDFISR